MARKPKQPASAVKPSKRARKVQEPKPKPDAESKKPAKKTNRKDATRKKGGRRSYVTRPTAKESLSILEREQKVLELYRNGASFRQISDQLTAQGHKAALGTVHADFKNALARRREEVDIAIDDMLLMAKDDFRDARLAIAPLRRNKPKEFLEGIALIWRELDRYFGFSKAQRADNVFKEAFAKYLGVDPSELPDPEPNE